MKYLTLTRRIVFTLLVLLTTTTMWAQINLTQDGDGNYLINDATDWNTLAQYVVDGNDCEGMTFLMTANIGTAANPITRPIGQQTSKNKTDRMRFKGTFDGGNYTLTIALNTSSSYWSFNKGYCSPFAYTWDATIKNLHVVGSVTTTGCWASGLVGSTGDNFVGTCNINNCQISVEITANYISTGSAYGNHGGIIGIAEGKAKITNTWFDGKFLGKDYQYSGGFIGMNKGKDTEVENCLFNPSVINIENNNVTGSFEFVHDMNNGNHTLTNAYWVKHFGEIENAQGQRVSTIEPDPTQYSYNTIEAVDGNDYYIVLRSVTWADIEDAIAEEDADFFNLASDVVAGTEDVAFVIPNGKTFELRMNGHTIDRGYALSPVQVNGYVIKVEAGGTLTINGGTITGGNNGLSGDQGQTDYNAGGIYNDGTLNINGATITGNYCKGNGAGIYNNGTLNINNATITGNNGRQQRNRGGGVYVTNSATMNIVGNVQIHDNNSVWADGTQYQVTHNVYLAGNNVINVTGSLSGSLIGVEGHTGIVTDGLDDNGNLSNFSSDDIMNAAFYEEGEIVLVAKEDYSKTINPYSSNTNNGWYLIASPVYTTPDEVTNMKLNKYDLYRFNQAGVNQAGENKEWENYKSHTSDFSIDPGQGYLYANSKKVTITFIGLPYEGNGQIALSYNTAAKEAVRGMNLVGNPFGTSATMDSDHDFYVLNDSRTDIIAGTNRTIDVTEGIIVKAEDANDTYVTFTQSTSKNNTIDANSIVMNVTSNNGDVIDRVIVRFNRNRALPKFMIDEDNTKFYIPQDGKNYAIVGTEKTGEMPVNFEAKEMGWYTINISGEDLNDVCLVDKIEGAVIDLSVNTSYTFVGSDADRSDRFKLVFDATSSDFENANFAYQSGNDIIVNGEGELQVFDVMGRMVNNTIVNGVEAIALPQGVYVFRMNGNVQKIVVR